MPLRDHFRPPLSVWRHWHSFHNGWAYSIAADLNTRLPERYFAEANVQFGIEIDVAAFEETDGGPRAMGGWTPPAPSSTVALPMLTDLVEIAVYNGEGGPELAGAIELVSPSNKDRPAHRDAFVAKCRTYLQRGLGLVIVDVVTDRIADLHAQLLRALDADPEPAASPLYAASYRPVERDGCPQLDLWREPLGVGDPLPTLPLWLPGALCLPVDLDASYHRTGFEQRLPPDGP